MVAIDIFECGD